MHLIMQQAPVRTVAPAAPVVVVDEMHEHTRIDAHDDAATLQIKIEAATRLLDGADGILGRCLITQTWRLRGKSWPAGPLLLLPFPDVQSVTITYLDSDGASQTFAASNWHLIECAGKSAIYLDANASWPSLADRPDAVTVTLVAGFGDTADAVPEPIRHCIMLLAGTAYENREAFVTGTLPAQELPFSVTDYLRPWVKRSF